jgi:hypothetical protein
MNASVDSGLRSGWALFAGIVLLIAGIARIFDAIWAFQFNGDVPEHLQGALLGTSLTTYGWVYLIVGVLLIIASFAILYGSQFGRWIGIIASGVGALSAALWLPYYSVWSVTHIALDLLVIYAIIAHVPAESTSRR